ncbi:MAG: hypothetical protein U1E06_19565 [Tabrizicola sp.]|nr:hypothetical protein [Tabrizicola sp.]
MEVMAWLEAHESLSGWAQAVGALITLWVGVHIAGSRQKTIAKAHALNARAIIRDAVEACVVVSNRAQASRQGTLNRDMAALDAKQDALMAFPIHELPPRSIERFYEFRKAIREFGRKVSHEFGDGGLPATETAKATAQFYYKVVYEEWKLLAKSLGIKAAKSGAEKKREREFSRAYDEALERDVEAIMAERERRDADAASEKSTSAI